MRRHLTYALALLLPAWICLAQTRSQPVENPQWRSPTKSAPSRTSLAPSTPVKVADARATSAAKPTVTGGATPALPSDQGQVWREYDISPYTSKVTSTEKPEQAVVDWILRETGTELWFTDAVGLLNASKTTLRVYHTPAVQRIVADLVDRFVTSEAQSYSLGLRLCTVSSPNWRTQAHPLLRPVTVQSPGVEAWLLSKENAALLISQLRKRSDYQEQSAPSIAIQNGQSQTVSQTRLRSYVKSVRLRETYPFFDLENGQIDEGYSLQLSPLFSTDGNSLDVVLKCHIDQVEKFVPVPMDVPTGGNAPHRVQVQVPQIVSWRLHERFRWPSDQVLLLSCGVVASPTGAKSAPLGLPVLAMAPGRADALLLVESHGKADAVLPEPPRPVDTGLLPITRGRY